MAGLLTYPWPKVVLQSRILGEAGDMPQEPGMDMAHDHADRG